MLDKITVIITTYSSEDYFKSLWDSLPIHKIDNVIVINGGEKYVNNYELDNKLTWVQHTERKNIAQSRNDGLRIAQELGNEHIFLIEDDMICLNENIFDEYIRASFVTRLEYFCFASYAWEAGPAGARTPRIKIEYDDKTIISCYKNTCNEFTYRGLSVLEDVGLYREDMHSFFDIEWIYRVSQTKYAPPFWYFPDIHDADKYIKNNPDAQSRIDPTGDRWSKLTKDYDIFNREHKKSIGEVPVVSNDVFIQKLRDIKLDRL